MEPTGEPPGALAAHQGRFATTHWSMVIAAGATDSREAAPALERLCRMYWYPLFAFSRRKGHDAEEACDLTQEFLARLLEKNFLGAADPAKGRFRTFLLTAFERFLKNEWTRARRQKRGGGRSILSLDLAEAEERYRLDPADELTAERIYERRWALTLLQHALERLREECAASGRDPLFEAVKSTLTGDAEGTPYAAVAAGLGMSEGAVKTAVHRLRRRYGEILRAEVAETVAGPEAVDEEIHHLFTVFE